jgi:hypothetical protein
VFLSFQFILHTTVFYTFKRFFVPVYKKHIKLFLCKSEVSTSYLFYKTEALNQHQKKKDSRLSVGKNTALKVDGNEKIRLVDKKFVSQLLFGIVASEVYFKFERVLSL